MGGLIQAYKTAASLALDEAEIIQKQIKMEVSIQFPYASMNEVMKLVKNWEMEIVSQKMEMDCNMQLEFREGIKDLVLSALEDVKDLILIKT
jgi:putative IMPACT (imprinted ancient) family translation regulator